MSIKKGLVVRNKHVFLLFTGQKELSP